MQGAEPPEKRGVGAEPHKFLAITRATTIKLVHVGLKGHLSSNYIDEGRWVGEGEGIGSRSLDSSRQI